MRATVIYRAGIVVVSSAGVLACSETQDDTPRVGANAIHDQAIVIDAHAHPKPGAAEFVSLGEKRGGFELDFLTMREGGLDAVFFSLPLLRSESTGLSQAEQVLEDVRVLEDEVRRFEELADVARSPGDILRIQSGGKRAILLSIEAGGDPFEGDVSTLERYFEAGIRMITLPSDPFVVFDSEQRDEAAVPINDYGRSVVAEMNRLGIIIDITHTHDRLQMDIIGASTKPVIASHSCTRALNNIPRQVPDSIIRALAENGGVIAVTFYPGHIVSGFPEDTSTVNDLVDHIDHIVQIAGIDHVGFGSDFLGSEIHTIGLESAAGLPTITANLLERGYSQEEIEKILGGNLLRVFEAVLESG